MSWRRTSAALTRVYRRAVRNCGSVWLWLSTMAVRSASKCGKWCSARLRPRAAKASRHRKPLCNSCRPLRSVPRFHPSSRSACLWPPGPSSLTVRAMKSRRALPCRDWAVCTNSALRESVHSIQVPPACDCLEYTMVLGRFNFRESLSVLNTPWVKGSSHSFRGSYWGHARLDAGILSVSSSVSDR